MRLVGYKLSSALLVVLTALICLILSFSFIINSVSADTRPYLKANGADVFAGGWFENPPGSCNPSDGNYQTGRGAFDDRLGGILTFANTGPPLRGSASQFGAFALGLIQGDGNGTDFHGFASRSSSGNNVLSFANTGVPGTNWGGLFEGATGQAHCIPDYYSKSIGLPADPGYTATDLNGGAHKYNAGNITIVGGTIPQGANTTLYVEGNVYITGDVSYQAGYNATNVPKFAVVAKGNIYIAPNVQNLSGFYIAQPTDLSAPGTTGRIWTCHDPVLVSDPDAAFLRGCSNRLTVNGAFSAAQVMLVRTGGDVLDNNANPAEVFNYTPEMVIGGGFFDDGSTGNTLKIDSVISLPPVF